MNSDLYYEDLNVLRELEDIEEIDNLHNPTDRRVKFYKIRINPFDLQEDEFKTKYRFSRATANFIIDMVKDELAGDARGGHIPPHIKVLTAIRVWGRGEIQDDAGDLAGMSQPSVSLICKQVALALVANRSHWIKMPQGDLEQNNVIANFYSICGFRQVIGAIDCTHIRIPKVTGDIGQYYINRKGYSSINVQVVCNADLEIMDIVAHWRGSTHDSRIFNESRLRQRFERNEFKGRLIGDSGYACTPYLFTPILNPRTQKEEAYNSAHIKTRNTVERCFGVWKQRFRCLLRGFTTKLDNTKLFIVALAMLHNIGIRSHDLPNEGHNIESEEANLPILNSTNNNVRGNACRAVFIEENF